jgi:hypothetical protein
MTKNHSTAVWGTIGLVGMLAGVGLLVLARYLLTNRMYSVSQTPTSHTIRDVGLLAFGIGIVALSVCVIQFSMRRLRKLK